MIFVFSACESLLSPLSLSDAQKVRLQSVEVLCCWCACDSLEAAHTIGVPSEVQASTIKSKLLELLHTDNIDLSRSVDVQLVSRDYSITNLVLSSKFIFTYQIWIHLILVLYTWSKGSANMFSLNVYYFR